MFGSCMLLALTLNEYVAILLSTFTYSTQIKIQSSSNIHNRFFFLFALYILTSLFYFGKIEFHGTIVYTVCVLYAYWHLCRCCTHIARACLCVFAQVKDVHYGLLIFSTFQSKCQRHRNALQFKNKIIALHFPICFLCVFIWNWNVCFSFIF